MRVWNDTNFSFPDCLLESDVPIVAIFEPHSCDEMQEQAPYVKRFHDLKTPWFYQSSGLGHSHQAALARLPERFRLRQYQISSNSNYGEEAIESANKKK